MTLPLPNQAAGLAAAAWHTPAGVPALGDAEVHVWLAGVASLDSCRDALDAVLSAGERSRADRFVFARDRAQYVTAHGLLRVVLARYLRAAPAELQFDVGPYGKPHLVGVGERSGLTFNLSHAGDLVAIAVSRRRALGVDVEQWVDDMEHDEVAERFFSPAERAELRSLPRDRKVSGFFACWSRKEAYIKGTGLGVSHGLDYFDVALGPDRPALLLADRLAPGTADGWTLYDLVLAPGYSGAVIGGGRDWRLDRLVATPQWVTGGAGPTIPRDVRAPSLSIDGP